MRNKFQIYQDARGEWRWRFLQNGRVTADSGEGYETKSGARKAIRKLSLMMFFSKVEEL